MERWEELRRELQETASRHGADATGSACVEDALAQAIERGIVDERIDVLREELILLHLRILDTGLRWRDVAAQDGET